MAVSLLHQSVAPLLSTIWVFIMTGARVLTLLYLSSAHDRCRAVANYMTAAIRVPPTTVTLSFVAQVLQLFILVLCPRPKLRSGVSSLHYYFSAVALHITQVEQGFALLLRCSRSTHNPSRVGCCFIIARIAANHMRQSLLHVLTCLPTAPWSRLMGGLETNRGVAPRTIY